MMLSTIQLEAFIEVARSKSFSEAANKLHITQSALSQRILNLEDKIQLTLFIRESTGIRLTEAGERLLRYCQLVEKLEFEYLGDLGVLGALGILGDEEGKAKGTDSSERLSGIIKIGGLSTFVRSLLIPKLGPFSRKNPLVQMEVMTREVRELPECLRSGQADFIFNTQPLPKQEIESLLIGIEKNVLIESKYKDARKDIYLDHDVFDTTTLDFWRLQKNTAGQGNGKIKRAYFDEIYTIIQAVQEGFGRAVVPYHLVQGNKKVSIVKGYKPLNVPVYLCYFKQSYYTNLQKVFIELLSKWDEF